MRTRAELLSPPPRSEFIAVLHRRRQPTGEASLPMPVPAAPSRRADDDLPLVAPPPTRQRLDGIDLVRGLAMVLMCLDHARDFVAAGGEMNPRNVNDAAVFLTRWITHFCAPVFILLAGVSAYLYGSRG